MKFWYKKLRFRKDSRNRIIAILCFLAIVTISSFTVVSKVRAKATLVPGSFTVDGETTAKKPFVTQANRDAAAEAAALNKSETAEGTGAISQDKNQPPEATLMQKILFWAFTPFFQLEGWILTQLTRLLMWIVKYQGFTSATAVQVGWTLVRDVANMFFVVILLAIALGTILRIESYNFKKLLPKTIIMAILVNFSLIISGIVLDFAQVIMLTFVSAFAAISGEGNIITALKIKEIVQYPLPTTTTGGTTVKPTNYGELLVTMILMVIMLAIACVVLLVYVVVFTIRIVMLWIYLILSPLAYITSAFPQGQRYAQQWWSEYTKYVIAGPILAFFLWLALAVGTTTVDTVLKDANNKLPTWQLTKDDAAQPVKTVGGVNSSEVMMGFIIVIALLLASLVITQQLGVAGGGFAGQMMGKMRQMGMAPISKGLNMAKGAAGLGWAAAKAPFQAAGRKINERIGEGKLTPWVNPAAMVRGWNQRRGERHEAAKELATAGARESWDKIITGTTMPHRQRLVGAREAKFAQEYASVMDNQEYAGKAVELMHAGHDVENQERKRAFVKAAGGQGYLDDAMSSKEMQGHMIGVAQERAGYNGPDKRKQQEAEYIKKTGLVDRMKKGEWYGYDQLHLFLQDFMGEDQNAQKTMASLEEDAIKTKHPEYYGHAEYRSREQGGNDEMAIKGLATPDDEEAWDDSAQKRAITEWSKRPGRDRIPVAPHGIFAYTNEGRRPGVAMTPFNLAIMGVSYGGQGTRIGEHGQKRNLTMLQGGTADHMNWEQEGEIAIIRGEGTESIENKKAALALAHQRGGDPKTLDRIWEQVGGKQGSTPQYRFVNVDANGNEVGSELVTGDQIKTMGDNPAQLVATINSRVGMGAPPPAGAAAAGAAAGAAGPRPRPRPRMAMGDDKKHTRTQEKFREYEQLGFEADDFYRSTEFQSNPEEYESGVDFRRHEVALNQEELDKMRGVRTASTRKAGAKQAGVGLNFNDPAIQTALGVTAEQGAVNFAAEDTEGKKKAVEGITQQYRQQLQTENQGKIGMPEVAELREDITKHYESKGFSGDELGRRVAADLEQEIQKRGGLARSETDIEAEVSQLQQGLTNAKSLRVHNNASLDSRRDQAGHEVAHETVDELKPEQVQTIWQSVDSKQQQAIMADMEKRYPGLSKEQQMEEAVVEMVGVGKGAYAPTAKTRQAAAAQGVKTKGDEMLERVSALASQGRALASRGKQAGKELAELGDLVAQLPGDIAGGVKAFASRAFGSFKAPFEKRREVARRQELENASLYLNERRTERGTVEQDANAKKSAIAAKQRGITAEHRKVMDERRQAEQSGDLDKAGELSTKANGLLGEKKKLDGQAEHEDLRIKRVRELETEAVDRYKKARTKVARDEAKTKEPEVAATRETPPTPETKTAEAQPSAPRKSKDAQVLETKLKELEAKAKELEKKAYAKAGRRIDKKTGQPTGEMTGVDSVAFKELRQVQAEMDKLKVDKQKLAQAEARMRQNAAQAIRHNTDNIPNAQEALAQNAELAQEELEKAKVVIDTAGIEHAIDGVRDVATAMQASIDKLGSNITSPSAKQNLDNASQVMGDLSRPKGELESNSVQTLLTKAVLYLKKISNKKEEKPGAIPPQPTKETAEELSEEAGEGKEEV